MSKPLPAPSPRDIRTAYRHLSLLALRAISHSHGPARHTITTKLRIAFRLSPRSYWDPKRIHNTCQFLYNAANHRALEHRVFRTLLYTWWWDLGEGSAPGAGQGRDLRELGGRERERRIMAREKLEKERKIRKLDDLKVWEGRMDSFRFMVRELNETMGMCLR